MPDAGLGAVTGADALLNFEEHNQSRLLLLSIFNRGNIS